MRKKLKLGGWKKKYMKDLEYFKCPLCEDCQETIFLDPEGYYECFKCKNKIHKDKMEAALINKQVVQCNECEEEVSLTSSNLEIMGGDSYICPKCNNTVAIKYQEKILDPTTPLRITWNKNLFENASKLEDGLFLKLCESKKDILVLKMLQLMGKLEDVGFRYIDLKNQKASLLFFNDKYLGYILWSEEESAILRQILIIEDERRKGYAEKMLRYWVDHVADKINDKFVVETPNTKTNNLLIKMGYAKEENNKLVGIKCSFIFCG